MKNQYCFDEQIDRKKTNAVKYNFNFSPKKSKDLLALWVADMDFKSPPEVIDALKSRVEHGIFGYTYIGDTYLTAIKNWMHDSFDWEIKNPWIVSTPGIVYALSLAVQSLTKEGDAVLIQQPVYPPFSSVITKNKRVLVNNSLIHDEITNKYTMNFEDFEEKIITHQIKVFILCNPHNPVGRVWTREELMRLGKICLKHHVTVVSDEIHQDFIYSGYKHEVFANLCPEFSEITLTCTAPSKTFNLAGLQTSNIIIKNEALRQLFLEEKSKEFIESPNLMGLVACEAAYTFGRPWLHALKLYLLENINYLNDFLNTQVPEISLVKPEGTYLAWLDLRKLNLTKEAQKELIVTKAKLWLNAGTSFGAEAQGYERMNIACPRIILEEACQRLKKGMASS